MLAVLLLTFLLIRLTGDPSETLLPIEASPELREQLSRSYGLDKPVALQFISYVASVARGQIGHSWRYGKPVLELLANRVPATLSLVVLGTGLAGLVGGTLGVILGRTRNRWLEFVATSIAIFGQSVPSFWFGILMVILFSVTLGWLPTSGMSSPLHFILPVMTIAAGLIAEIMSIVRVSVSESIGAGYVTYARAKGVHEPLILRRHVLPNAAIPFLSLLSVQIGTLLSGAVVVEFMFSWPGIGLLAVESVLAHDFPVVQGAVVFFASAIVFINMAFDLLYGMVDPRIRRG